jgi:cytochrome c oxidase cbb3-type subunit 2
VGGKYSDAWHATHLIDPRSVVPESVMPSYKFLAEHELDYGDIVDRMKVLRTEGVPYTADQLTNAKKDLEAQADPYSTDAVALRGRYGAKVVNRDFDGDPNRITEVDALVAYLQMLGTQVDFKSYKAQSPENQR